MFLQRDKLQLLIDEGEHQTQDFKFAINDSKKIARSLVAFANTDGGRLLIGIKDNGAIAGVRSDEEFYMVEAAAQMYCKPEIVFQCTEHKKDGKTVLEVFVEKSELLHAAADNDGNFKVYTRVNDQNLLVNDLYIKAFEMRKKEGLKLAVTPEVKAIFSTVETSNEATFDQIYTTTQIRKRVIKTILILLMALNIVTIRFTETNIFYSIRENAHLA